MTNASVTRKILKSSDRLIRVCVRNMLLVHLNKTCYHASGRARVYLSLSATIPASLYNKIT